MIIPEYARYERSVLLSCKFLEEFNISQFPINPFAVIEKEKWGLITYTEMAETYNCSIDDTINSLGSRDGFTIYDGINYTIAYNDAQPKKRVLFTLLHEIGHVYLNHLDEFEHTTIYRGSLTKAENKVLENEANTFARNVLSPSVFVKQLKDKSKKNLSRYFGISYEAAQTRLELLDSDYQHIENTNMKVRLYKIFYMYHNRYGCSNCGAISFIKKPSYCPICGKKKLKWSDGDMHYKKYEAHEKNNKLKICPVCNNEDTNIEGEFCQICGNPLINRCDDRRWDNHYEGPCGKSVPTNARYCPFCGNPTTFFNEKVLKDWQVEKKEKEEDEDIENKLRFVNIPDSLDEELPFN